MSNKIKLVQGDTGPQIRLTLTNQATNQPIDLTNASVTLHFRAVGSDTVIFSRPAFINPDTDTTGVCVLVWEEGDLDVEEGDYEGEIEVIRGSGESETLYDLLKFKVRKDFA